MIVSPNSNPNSESLNYENTEMFGGNTKIYKKKLKNKKICKTKKYKNKT